MGLPNEKSNSLIYIRYFHIQQSICIPRDIIEPRQIMEGETVFEGQTMGEIDSHGALGGGRGALAERGA